MAFTTQQLVIFAARSGDVAALRNRVRAGGDVNHFDPRYGAPLMAAIHAGRLHTIQWLLDNGADVNAEYSDQIGPLEVALRHPDPEVVYLLLRAGARLRKKTRPYYAARLEECLKTLGRARTSAAGASNKPGGSDRKLAKTARQLTSSTGKRSTLPTRSLDPQLPHPTRSAGRKGR